MAATWDELPAGVRAQVLRMAARGKHHDDYAVAEAAYLWARNRPGNVAGIVFTAAIDAATGSSGDVASGLRERRESKAILSVGVPTHGPYCPECHHQWRLHPGDGEATVCSGCTADKRRGLLTRPECLFRSPTAP